LISSTGRSFWSILNCSATFKMRRSRSLWFGWMGCRGGAGSGVGGVVVGCVGVGFVSVGGVGVGFVSVGGVGVGGECGAGRAAGCGEGRGGWTGRGGGTGSEGYSSQASTASTSSITHQSTSCLALIRPQMRASYKRLTSWRRRAPHSHSPSPSSPPLPPQSP
jgi:hypothetical protein